MLLKNIIFLSPYILLFILSFFSPWFLFIDKKIFISTTLSFLVLHLSLMNFSLTTSQKLSQILEKYQKIGILTFGTISGLAILFLPNRDLRLGDGLLLLENMSLETAIYGYQLITDEILEGLIHSITHNVLKNDPRISFQIWSSLIGIILLLGLGKYFWTQKNGFCSFLLFISSGGFLLFYGYVENYSLTTAYLIGVTLFIVHKLENNQNVSPYLLGLVAAFGASLHLVFGYTIFSFIYLTWLFYPTKRDFFLNSIKGSLVAICFLFLIFGYFFFVSDLQIDLGMSHVTTHKFYPIQRWFSTSHFKEIFFCILFTSLPALFTFLYLFLFEKESLVNFFSSKIGKYLLIVLIGFFLHAFWHNPQLGFPADWDLMSFYWSILVIICTRILEKIPSNVILLFPAYFFSFVLFQANVFTFSKQNFETEKRVLTVTKKIQNFQEVYSKNPPGIQPKDRKFHLHTYYFFYRTLQDLENRKASTKLIENGKNLLQEFIQQQGNYTKEWKKDFLVRSTKFHEEYLEFMKKDL